VLLAPVFVFKWIPFFARLGNAIYLENRNMHRKRAGYGHRGPISLLEDPPMRLLLVFALAFCCFGCSSNEKSNSSNKETTGSTPGKATVLDSDFTEGEVEQ